MSLEITMLWLMPPLLALLMLFLPQLSRSNTFFAVTVDADLPRSKIGRQIMRRYRIGVLASTLLGLASIAPLWWWLPPQWGLVAANLSGTLIVVFGSLLAFIACRGEAMHYSQATTTQRSATLQAVPPLGHLIPGSIWLHLAPYALILASAAWLGIHWQAIPEQVVMQVQGDTVRTSAKSIGSVFAVPLIMLATLLLTHACMLLARFIRRLPGYLERVRAINGFLLGVIWMIAVMGSHNALVVLYGSGWITGPVGITINLASLAAILLLPVIMWWRGAFGPSAKQSGQGDRTPDSSWRLGMFYYNPDDSALWVEKRFGVGYTVNFARPAAWLLIIGVLAVSALIVVMSLNAQ
jgi:uncharacterized membrane protein